MVLILHAGRKRINVPPFQYRRALKEHQEHQEHQHLVALVCTGWKNSRLETHRSLMQLSPCLFPASGLRASGSTWSGGTNSTHRFTTNSPRCCQFAEIQQFYQHHHNILITIHWKLLQFGFINLTAGFGRKAQVSNGSFQLVLSGGQLCLCTRCDVHEVWQDVVEHLELKRSEEPPVCELH